MKRLVALLIFIFVIGLAALAQDGPPMPPQGGGGQMRQFQMPTFAELDKNKDGKISRDEFPSQFPPQMFDRLDTNHDGQLSFQEFAPVQIDPEPLMLMEKRVGEAGRYRKRQ